MKIPKGEVIVRYSKPVIFAIDDISTFFFLSKLIQSPIWSHEIFLVKLKIEYNSKKNIKYLNQSIIFNKTTHIHSIQRQETTQKTKKMENYNSNIFKIENMFNIPYYVRRMYIYIGKINQYNK